jgi:hypothetical protein
MMAWLICSGVLLVLAASTRLRAAAPDQQIVGVG